MWRQSQETDFQAVPNFNTLNVMELLWLAATVLETSALTIFSTKGKIMGLYQYLVLISQ